MKKKQTIAILLSVLLLTSVTLPGTWAQEDTVGDVVNEAEPEATPEAAPAATESDTDTETESDTTPVEDTESDTESETLPPETETESETETETLPPETETETTPTTDTVIVEVENTLCEQFDLLMDDASMDSRTKWSKLCEMFQLDESMDVLTILTTIAEKLEMDMLQLTVKFESMIKTILDEIKAAVTAPEDISELVEELMATDLLSEFENIVNTYLIENQLEVIFFEDPAEFDKVNDYYIYLSTGKYPNHDPIVYDQYGNLISGDDGSLDEDNTDFGANEPQ